VGVMVHTDLDRQQEYSERMVSAVWYKWGMKLCVQISPLFLFLCRNLMEDIDIHRIDSPSFFALGKL